MVILNKVVLVDRKPSALLREEPKRKCSGSRGVTTVYSVWAVQRAEPARGSQKTGSTSETKSTGTCHQNALKVFPKS